VQGAGKNLFAPTATRSCLRRRIARPSGAAVRPFLEHW